MKNIKEIKFKLKEKVDKETDQGHKLGWKLVPAIKDLEKDIEIKIKDEDTATGLGIPVDMIGDEILVTFGATNKQGKIPTEEKP